MAPPARFVSTVLLLLLMAGAANGYSGTQLAPAPGGAVFGDIGCSHDGNHNLVPDNAVACLDDLDGSGTPVATDNGSDSDGTDDFASGSCIVDPVYIAVAGEYTFACGTDRDDDGMVTNADLDGSSDESCDPATGLPPLGPNDCFDDEFAVSGVVSSSDGRQILNVCFTRDRAVGGVGGTPALPGDWDDVVVFIGPAQPTPFSGTVTAGVDLTSHASPWPCPTRSGHNDPNYHA